ncbi:hypothetical protein HanPSC8_Chr03g0084611 [Helianthus annuus]|nr:hypothetical protein HanPSC8_Chr03g0084611 [Helianthus annuus]
MCINYLINSTKPTIKPSLIFLYFLSIAYYIPKIFCYSNIWCSSLTGLLIH